MFVWRNCKKLFLIQDKGNLIIELLEDVCERVLSKKKYIHLFKEACEEKFNILEILRETFHLK